MASAKARSSGTRVIAGTVLLLLVTLATGCGGSGYTYVSSKSTKTFFKVPDSWEVFDKGEVLDNPGQYLAADASDRFLVAFDGHPEPTLRHDFVTGNYPFGVARVRELGMEEHDQYSFMKLRNEIVPLDDLLQQNEGAVSLEAPAELLTREGLRGSKLEYTVHLQGGSFTMAQVGFVDTETRTVWFLAVGCSADCYRQHKGDIHRVLDSWRVEEK